MKYPVWKKIMWRYVRVFLVAFLSTVSWELLFGGNLDVVKAMMISAIAAGVAASLKLLREGEPYNTRVHKLPL